MVMRFPRFFRLAAVVFAGVLVFWIALGRGHHTEIRVLGKPLPGEQDQIQRLVRGNQWWDAKIGASLLCSPWIWRQSFPSWMWSPRDEARLRVRGIFGSTRRIVIQDAPIRYLWYTRYAFVQVTDPFDKTKEWQYDIEFVTNGWRIESCCYGFR